MNFKPSRVLGSLPLLLSLVLGGFALVPKVRANPILVLTFLVTAALLAIWWLVLTAWMVGRGRTPEFAVALLKQHYLQACVHLSILAYWGWYFRVVYQEAYLILAQLVFAYTFDMLLQLTRKGKYTLGFGPFPVIFSTNLFLWFLDDWFYFQFMLIAVGFAAKDLIHWTRNGKSVHIFNPSSFPLAVACWILMFTHQFPITYGNAIAGSQFRPPGIYLFIFLVALPGQLFFGVTTMTLSAVLTMYGWAAAYQHFTGVPYHFQSQIPIAVFLAMNLLFTDPSTSPRSELGRVFFGVAYALTVIGLELTVEPQFPSKLLLVPALNLAVPIFDRLGQSQWLRAINPSRLVPLVTGLRRNLGYISVWAVVFAGLISLRGLGDEFPAQEVPFWREACETRGERACGKLRHLELTVCRRKSGWACNELGIAEHQRGDEIKSAEAFMYGCQFGSQAACTNAQVLAAGGAATVVPPTVDDYRILLSVYKWSRLEAVKNMSDAQVLMFACKKGWTEACSGGPSAQQASRGPL